MTDFTGKTAAEITELIAAATTALYAAQQAEAADIATRRAQIGGAISGLEALHGPAAAAAGVDSIRAVRAFDDLDTAAGKPRGQTMGENAGLALSLAFEGLDILTSLVRDIATITGETP